MPETTRRKPPPLDSAALDRLALRYVERFATTRGRLADYLRRKVRERGWEGTPADPTLVAERMADLGYIDDRAYAEAKASAMGRRGLGARRIAGAFRQAGIEQEDAAAVAPTIADGAGMLRAGHPFDLARRIVACPPGDPPQLDDFE
jgi:regulatory protein